MNVTTSAVSSRNFVIAMPTKREENKESTEEEEEKKKKNKKKGTIRKEDEIEK